MIYTIVERLYCQDPKDDPFFIESAFEKQLEKEEEPYQRAYTINSTPGKIDLGWMSYPGMIHIYNKDREESIKVIYQGATQGLIVPPQESIRFYPTSFDKLRVTAKKKVKAVISVFPK